MTIIQNYIKEQLEIGRTKASLIKQWKISRPTLDEIEFTGEIKNLEILKRIAVDLRISPNDLLGWDDLEKRFK